MSFSVPALRALLGAHTPAAATGFAVALSGGADSAALLAALSAALSAPLSVPMAASGRTFRDLPLRALHVDHGLQAAAAEFRDACGELCRRLGVPFRVIPVVVPTPAGVSVEASARTARYAALARSLREGECLLTAHHREDQAETLLLQTLRGAGLRGLSAMPLCRPLGAGWHLRPVLDVPQHELLALGLALAASAGAAAPGAAPAGAAPAADPMNEDLRFDRVYLRRRLWPLIETRWPGAGAALSRTARHLAEAQELLDHTAGAELARLRDGAALSLPRLRALNPAERIHALRYWLREAGAEPPSTARLKEALRQLIDAHDDHLPAVVWGECALRRYRDRVFLTEAQPPRLQGTRRWEVAPGSRVELGSGLGALRFAVVQRGGIAPHRLPQTLSVRARAGGETLKPAAHAKTQSVQHLCQSHGVLPWLRDALPFVYADAALIAVADLWQDARWSAGCAEPGLVIEWERAPLLV